MVIDSWENGQYKEIWVYAKEGENDERALCGLINGELDYFPLSYDVTHKTGDGSPGILFLYLYCLYGLDISAIVREKEVMIWMERILDW